MAAELRPNQLRQRGGPQRRLHRRHPGLRDLASELRANGTDAHHDADRYRYTYDHPYAYDDADGHAHAARSRLCHELWAGAGLEHPNLLQTYGGGREGESYFLVVEYAAGRNLARLVRDQGALPVADLVARLETEVREKTIRQTSTATAGLTEGGAKYGE